MLLTTPNLLLRELRWNDIEDIHSLHLNPKVERFNTIGIPCDLAQTEEVLKPAIEDIGKSPRTTWGWTVRLRSDDQFIGEAGMSVMNNRYKKASIHYHITPELWGNGYATEVAKELVRFAFEDLKLHRVEAGAATENIGSHKVMEKAGMTREGLCRKILPIRGQWYDNYMYAILDTDFRP